MSLRALALALLLAPLLTIGGAAAIAEERIDNFGVVIDVATNGDITVTETITVTAEGNRIRRGIFRDLPRFYTGNGDRYAYSYDVQEVSRNGDREPYEIERDGNAFRIRIGDADVFLPNGQHTYEIRYRVANQIRYFDDYDEIYWNVTGNYWEFPIRAARATVILPDGAEIISVAGYTGPLGATGDDYQYSSRGVAHQFMTTRPLARGEGLTVAVGFAKGLIDPPSAADKSGLWWQRYGALVVLLASLGGVGAFYWRSFDRVGRDPQKGPVFPRYEPPEGYSPAGVHHIYYRSLRGHDALIATLMNLAVKGRLEIDTSGKKSTTLTHKPDGGSADDISQDGRSLESYLFGTGNLVTLRGKYDAGFTRDYLEFQKRVKRLYGSDYFKWNAGYVVVAVVASVIAIILSVRMSLGWTLAHTVALLALAGLNGVFMYLMPAPTRKGQDVRTEIEGFRLYLDTAEKLQLNAVEVGSEAPPPMTVERYERFLPYAIALGVEKPWTKHFEHLLPEEAANYRPRWATTHGGRYGSISALNSAIVGNISSGVSSAMPQSSGSSGSGGGGSSGGGGGGGGGGGW